MNRQEFFRRLEDLLYAMPENERMDALAYYNDYFDEAGVENEQRVIQELGSPEAVAQIILENYYGTQRNTWNQTQTDSTYRPYDYAQSRRNKTATKSRREQILWIILLVVTFPIWISILAAVFGIILGLLGGVFGVTVGVGGAGIGLFFGGFVLLFVGVLRFFTSPIEGIVTIGVGAILSAISIVLLLFTVLLLFRCLPIVVRAVVKWIRGFLVHQRGGNKS